MSGRARLLPVLLLAALCLAGVGAAVARAQTPAVPQVSVALDKSTVTVGDPIQLTVTVRHAPAVTIETTSIDDQLGPFEPLGSQPPDEHTVNGVAELRLRYTIAVYNTGPQQLPQLTFAYTSAGGAQGQATSSGPVTVTVDSVVPAGVTPVDIKPLKPQASLPAPASLGAVWAGLVGLAVFAVLLAAAGAWLLRRARRTVLAPAPSSAETARAELERILALDLPAQGELIEHYRLLGVCIRRYLSDRFGFPAQRLTSGELADAMEQRGVSRWASRLVSGLLSECDNVVYARYAPAAPRLAADNAMAFEIVDAAEGFTEPAASARAG